MSTGVVSALVVFAVACTDIVPPPTAPSPARPTIPTHVDPVISANIDLDQTDLILHYKTMQAVVVDIIPPWGSAASTAAPDNIRFDHFTRDGWVVVYNTFDVNQTNQRPVMVLYNKYRGILRWWWYNDQQPAGPSNYLTYALMVDGNATSEMNFVGEFAKDYTVQSSHPFAVKAVNGQFNQGLIAQAWYYVDTEFAYDPSIAGQAQANYSLALNGWSTSEAKLALTGDVNGTIDGSITGSGSGASLIGALNIAVTGATSAVTILDNGSKTENSLSNKTNDGMSSYLSSAIKSALHQLATQGLKLAGSQLQKVFNSLIGGDPKPDQNVELTLAAKITMNGSMTTDGSAVFFKGALPGTARGDGSGYLPYYNETLGLWNLAAPPVVRWRVVTGLYPPTSPGQKDVQYFADTPQINVNPAVASEVTISQPTASLIYIKQYSGSESFSQPNYLASNGLSRLSLANNVYGNEWYGFSAPYAVRYDFWTGTPETNIVVQVEFTVTPNDGSPPVDIIKLYKPVFQPM